jgi:hypothetical protein
MDQKILERRRSLVSKQPKQRRRSMVEASGSWMTEAREATAGNIIARKTRSKTVSGAGLAAAREARLRHRKKSELRAVSTRWGTRNVLDKIVEGGNTVMGAAAASPNLIAARLRREQLENGKADFKAQKELAKKEAHEKRLKQQFWFMHIFHSRIIQHQMDKILWNKSASKVQQIFRSWYTRAEATERYADFQEAAKIKAGNVGCWLQLNLKCTRRRLAARTARIFLRAATPLRHLIVCMQVFKRKCDLVLQFIHSSLVCKRARRLALDLKWRRIGLSTIKKLEKSYTDDSGGLQGQGTAAVTTPAKMANKLRAKYAQLEQTLASSDKLNLQQDRMIAQNRQGAAEQAKAMRAERIVQSCAKTQDAMIDGYMHRCRRSHMKKPEVPPPPSPLP